MTDNFDDLPEAERPLGWQKAKARVRELLADPKHDRPKGHPDDERTRDDPMPE